MLLGLAVSGSSFSRSAACSQLLRMLCLLSLASGFRSRCPRSQRPERSGRFFRACRPGVGGLSTTLPKSSCRKWPAALRPLRVSTWQWPKTQKRRRLVFLAVSLTLPARRSSPASVFQQCTRACALVPRRRSSLRRSECSSFGCSLSRAGAEEGSRANGYGGLSGKLLDSLHHCLSAI